MFRLTACLRFLLILLLSGQVSAAIETERRIGDFQLYFNALPSTFIPASAAKAVGIARDEQLGVLNLAIHDLNGVPLKVDLQGYTQDLLQRKEALEFLLVEEGAAIYYLANFDFSDQETLHFIVDVQPLEGAPFQLKFTRTLYRE